MLVRLFLFLSFAQLGFWPAASKTRDIGQSKLTQADSVSATRPKQLAKIGDDVIRFSRSPALGGTAQVIEIHRRDKNWAVGKVHFLYGHPATRWEVKGSLEIELPIADYDALAAAVDAELTRGHHADFDRGNSDVFVVCSDGPGYLTERYVAGKTETLRGHCAADHPNDRIARMMAALVARNLAKYQF